MGNHVSQALPCRPGYRFEPALDVVIARFGSADRGESRQAGRVRPEPAKCRARHHPEKQPDRKAVDWE
jgi:hypothetical protein